MKTKVTHRGIAIALIIALIASIAITVNFLGLSKGASAAENTEFMKIPQLTVLTHGLSSRASNWSNPDGNGTDVFVEDSDALIYKLSEKAGGAYIYRAKTSGGNIDPSYVLYESYDTDPVNPANSVDCINDISKHIILVFDSTASDASNDAVYAELEEVLIEVINKVASLNPGNKKPKVNLIGHSRGGITNLQFALDHPEYVESMISIGTPYFGSPVAGLAGPLVFEASDGLDGIDDASLYDSYYERWTAGYDTKYKDINSIAIGATTTIEYQLAILNSLGGKFSNEIKTLIENYSDDIKKYWAVTLGYTQYDSLAASYPEIAEMFSQDEFKQLLHLIGDEVFDGVWYGDVLVPVGSQQGVSGNKNYYFSKYLREFNSENASYTPKLASAQVALIHNIETYDTIIHDYILDNIRVREDDFIGNEVSVVGYEEVPTTTTYAYKWKVKIMNTHNSPRTYAYNSCLSFVDDAKNWTGLEHIEALYMDSGESAIVDVYSNNYATSIAVSSISGSTRYITYSTD